MWHAPNGEYLSLVLAMCYVPNGEDFSLVVTMCNAPNGEDFSFGLQVRVLGFFFYNLETPFGLPKFINTGVSPV